MRLDSNLNDEKGEIDQYTKEPARNVTNSDSGKTLPNAKIDSFATYSFPD